MAKLKQKTFTAKVIIPGAENPRYIPDCIIYKGKLVALVERGIGEPKYNAERNSYGDYDEWEEYSSYVTKMKPYLSKALMGDRIAHFQAILKKSDNVLSPENEDELLAVSFQIGENEGGYMVINTDKEKEDAVVERLEKVANREITLIVCEQKFGYSISERLPSNVWNKLRPYAKYWSAEDIDEWNEDMDDFEMVGDGKYLKGWYYQKEIIDILNKEGFKLDIR